MSNYPSLGDRQKLQFLNHLSALGRSAEELIHGGMRDVEEVGTLFEALEAFKNGKLAAIVCRYRQKSVDDLSAICEVELATLPFIKNDLLVLKKRGVRYLGELYYMFFDPHSPNAVAGKERIMRIIATRFNVPWEMDPLALGWIPSYWSDPAFLAELNVLILDRRPTPPAPDFEAYCALSVHERDQYIDSDFNRGMARWFHQKEINFAGEILTHRHSPNQRCPHGMHQASILETVYGRLESIGSRLWASAIVPPNWSAPDWKEGPWQNELESIAREEQTIASILARRRSELPPVVELLGRSIDTLGLQHWTERRLNGLGVELIIQLIAKSEQELAESNRHHGKWGINIPELKQSLAELGLHLKP